MDTKRTNPLAKHFRQPAIYINLPSGGQYWPENTLDLPANGSIPVYPMTTSDEITLKTPDALINGAGIVNVIQSCIPSIRDAWKMPSVDVDAVLIAIRIASYGTDMTVSSKCPHCAEEQDYDVNLTKMLDNIRCPDFNVPVTHNNLKIKLAPQQYFIVNQNNITNFEEQKIMQALSNKELDEEVRNAQLATSMRKLLEANLKALVGSTEYIETEDGERVTDPAYIQEFYENADSRITKIVEERLAKMGEEGALPLIDLACEKCNEPYSIPLEFDYARFFELGS